MIRQRMIADEDAVKEELNMSSLKSWAKVLGNSSMFAVSLSFVCVFIQAADSTGSSVFFHGGMVLLMISLVLMVPSAIMMVIATPPKATVISEVTRIQEKYRLDKILKQIPGTTGIVPHDDGWFAISIWVKDQETADKLKCLFRDNIEGVPIEFCVRDEIPVVGDVEKKVDSDGR